MKIIQTYSLINETNTYNVKYDNIYINLHLFLLSYLTLKKYYGAVTMYCDQNAYDVLIKHIPYDEVIIEENPYKNDPDYWSVYKVYIMNKMKESFIHVDTDVFIFDHVFDEFIKGDYDLLSQDILLNKFNPVQEFIDINRNALLDYNLIGPNFTDGFCSGGVLGIKQPKNILKYSFINEQVKLLISNRELVINKWLEKRVAGIIEEFSFYLLHQTNRLKIATILNTDDINEKGVLRAGENVPYCHMWFKSKYIEEYVDLVKTKTIKLFPTYAELVSKIDALILENKDTYIFKHGPNIEEYYIKTGLYNWPEYEIKTIKL